MGLDLIIFQLLTNCFTNILEIMLHLCHYTCIVVSGYHRSMRLKRLSFVILQMMNISFWSMKQKSPKLRLTAGKKGRYPPFWCFFESNILLMTSPSFCEYSTGVLLVLYVLNVFIETVQKSFLFFLRNHFLCFLGTDWLVISTTYSCVRISWRTGFTVMRRRACFWLLLLYRLSLGITCQRYWR